MRVIVSCEFRFLGTPDGQIWTSSAFAYGFWQRYLTVFTEVAVLARVKPVDAAEPDWQKVTGPQVQMIALPYYVGLSAMLKKLPELTTTLRTSLESRDCIIYRVPSQTAVLAWLLKPKHRFALEVVGDPADVFDAGITRPITARLLKSFSAWQLRRMARQAVGVSYVTRDYLQCRYPAVEEAVQVACSSIELSPEWVATTPRHYAGPARHLLFVGSFNQLYKGQDLMLSAMQQLLSRDKGYQLVMIGGGNLLDTMKKLAGELGIGRQVQFTGELSQAQMRPYFQQAELFVMPSRTEGLPRALIEAMAHALPALGTSVGGIPELLPTRDLVPVNDCLALAEKIASMADDCHRLTNASKRNLQVSKCYQRDTLAGIRSEFYQAVSQRWVKQ
ncbi:glycosyltransferase family 4 protein [Bowmanella dokdonensis]|uniref:Glycosyltransferase family 4 protein n=1 Tax=Bowmanella dokdonensis TaxID=751969 RepID=A0A939DLZ2_9ALTE|nr:glycosyltransferase family 4 protein [Bowmanella dokdonensis]MBN7825082.1 glycosyltransferase family 4 protein [Bowmanella dokdonensis]